MDVANNYTTCYCQLYRRVPVPFSIVQQFHPTCPCTFYTCSTLHLKKILRKCLIYRLDLDLYRCTCTYMYKYVHVDVYNKYCTCDLLILHVGLEGLTHLQWLNLAGNSIKVLM